MTPTPVQQRRFAMRECLKYAPADRPVFAPDCGLSRTARWAAKQKLANMVAGVRKVRQELGIAE
jgi:5-methyltetrahydropteroyltriglutamate--homocysteine methyltransferase